METNRIRQFCVVAETLNLRKSAELLHLSHSALSKSLKTLQAEVDRDLFVQVGRRLVLTDEGRVFYQKALTFLEQETVLLKTAASNTPTLRIGTFEVFSTHVLGSTFGEFFPETELELHELLPGRLEAALVQGKVDFGITYEPIPSEGVEFVRIARSKMAVVARKGAFAKTPFSEIPFAAPIHPIEGTPTGNKGLDGWPDDRVIRKVRYKVDMLESAVALAREGGAAVFIPKFLVSYLNRNVVPAHHLGELERPLSFKPIYRNIYLLHRAGTPENAMMRKLAQLLRTRCID